MKRRCVLLGCLLAMAGCTTRTTSTTPRTAVEMLLLSTAVDSAMEKFHMPELIGQRVYVDFSRLESYDEDYVRQAVRTAIARQQAVLVDSPDDADLTVEVASGGVGMELKTGLVGIPEVPLLIPQVPITLPEVPLYKAVDQTALAKLLIFAHDDGRFVAAAEYWAKADRFESFILWWRFIRRDDLVQDWIEADLHLEERSDGLPLPPPPGTPGEPPAPVEPEVPAEPAAPVVPQEPPATAPAPPGPAPLPVPEPAIPQPTPAD